MDESDRRQADDSESRFVEESESHTPYDDDDPQDMLDETKADDDKHNDEDDIELSSFDNDSATEPSRSKRKGRIRRGLLKIKLRRKNKKNSELPINYFLQKA